MFALGFEPGSLDVDPAEEQRLKEELGDRLAADQEGDNAFALSEEEAKSIEDLAKKEEEYFPASDFVDVLLELMVRNNDDDAFREAAKMIRSIIFALVENLDFQHASQLLTKLSSESLPGLTTVHVREIEKMIGSFCDKQTVELIDNYLAEFPTLPSCHGVFKFLSVFDHNAVSLFCPLLRHKAHTASISEVLLTIGPNCGGTFEKFLDDPDSAVAKGVLTIIAQSDDAKRIQRIAKAMHHPDPELRKSAGKLILDLAEDEAAPYLLPLLDESNQQLLNFALQYFAKVPNEVAYERLKALTESGRFFDLDNSRQIHAFKALIASGGTEGLEYVTQNVLKHAFTLRSKTRRRKAAALLALSDSTSSAAIATLERFAGDKKNSLAASAQRAIKIQEQDVSSPGAKRHGAAARRPGRIALEKNTMKAEKKEVARVE